MNKKQYPIPATIVIRLNGDETTATILGDEFKISGITRTRAKRNPKDEYDAYIGARVALDRLFGKDFFEEHQEDDEPKKDKEEPKKSDEPEKAETPKEETEFQVGDIVRITNPIHVIPLLEPYERDDVAVIKDVCRTPAGFGCVVRIRSKERKGKLAIVTGDELTLLHRAKGAEQA